jgi:hypothetical protein
MNLLSCSIHGFHKDVHGHGAVFTVTGSGHNTAVANTNDHLVALSCEVADTM